MTDTMPEKMDLATTPIREERVEQLRGLFPEAFTEGDIDFDALRRSLGGAVSTDPANERFGLRWPGKSKLQQVINQPSIGTLVPQPEESVDWDTTQNLIIEGDNLEVLKLLQKSYAGQVKMIYIDPPYNTGNDFVYPDNFTEGLQTYLEFTGQVDSGGRKLSTNTDTTGRYHANWLNMMYPRLYLARNLLRDDGVFFVSIDDHEVHNLRSIMNEVFGEENFIVEIVWEKTRKNDAKLFSVGHEYMLVYARDIYTLKERGTVWREPKPGAKELWDEYLRLRSLLGTDDQAIEAELREWFRNLPASHPSKKLSRYKHVDEHGPWRDRDISWPGGGGPRYDVIHPVTGQPCKVPERGWVFPTKESMNRQIELGLVVFRETHDDPPYRKAHLAPIPDEEDTDGGLEGEDDSEEAASVGLQVMPSVIYKQSQVAVKQLRALMGAKLFNNPKDHEVIGRLIRYCTVADEGAIILDFFAGSGTTAHAVIQQNAEDGGNRRYILVQLPEPLEEPRALDNITVLNDIAEICRERVRRAARKVCEDYAEKIAEREIPLDTGFRAYGLAESSFLPWDGRLPSSSTPRQGELLPDANIAKQLEMAADHLRPDATDEAILSELLLKIGLELTAPVTVETLAGKRVYNVEHGTVLICLDRHITLEVIEEMASRLPAEIICLDAGFPNDQTKVNAGQIIASAARDEDASIQFKVV